MRAVPFFRASVLTLAAVFEQHTAFAQVDEERLRLMHEPISYTDVIDARDDRDLFDLNAHLDYARTRETGTIGRERTSASGQRTQEKVAQSERIVSQLVPGVDVGLYRDLMAFVRMPLILSDSRKLSLPHGVTADQASARLSDASGPDSTGGALFGVPFSSPTRAGLDYLAIGAAWAPFNQMRKAWLPTWVLRIEGRRAVGRTLRACTKHSDATLMKDVTDCGSTSTEDRDGDGKLDGTHGGSGAGSSRGVSALLAETRFSHRYRRAEPYAGLSLLVEWASTARDVFRDAGYGHARPGPQTGATLGLALIPWEDRGAFQRIVFDLRATATHVGRGTDYTPLFDVLGTSRNPDLDVARQNVSFYGLTEVQSYLRYGGQLGVEVQAARYVRFAVGSQMQWATEHALSGRDACNGPSAGTADDGRVCSSGRADRRERGVIDAPGRRFIMRDQVLLGVYAQATASF
ncbi:MAG: hypothetical protein JWN04_4082 [Myxococcaceae bacterium]|nr:hypothetical protein [Myxococcaceae bacterium]